MSTKNLIKKAERKRRAKENSKHYIKSTELWNELKKCSKNGKLSRKAIDYFCLLAEKLSTSDEFYYEHEEDREDCIAGGVHDAVSYWQNFIPYNKSVYMDLIYDDLIEVNLYEFCDKQHDPLKSFAPYKVWVNYNGDRMAMYRYDTKKGEGIDENEREVTYIGYKNVYPEVIKQFKTKVSHKFMSLRSTKNQDKYVVVDCGQYIFHAPTKKDIKDSFEIFIDKFSKHIDDSRRAKKYFNEIAEPKGDMWVATFTPPPFMDYLQKDDGNYELREMKKKVLSNVEYRFYDSKGNEIDEPDESQKIQLLAEDVFPIIEWLPHQKYIRDELFKKNHIKDIDISHLADDDVVDTFENLKRVHSDKDDLTSNAFSYVTQIIKIGFYKQWNTINKISYADKVSLNTASANNGFFSI